MAQARCRSEGHPTVRSWLMSIRGVAVRCVGGSQAVAPVTRRGDAVRKVVAIENVSLDGFADSGQGLGFEWTARAYDEEVDRFSNEHVRADVDTAMYGRATYLGMQGFWHPMLTNQDASPAERSHAEWVNAVDKVVFSSTLPSADWANSTLVRGDLS